uniref:P53 and DNA damage-regulated protein 1 n=1 Tax=Glossina pallidipes TaxID=7398 RepID=A0A1A9ZYG1_GLOPL
MKIIKSIEEMADKIFMNKQELIALNKRRQRNRESIRELQKNPEDKDETKIWITVSSMLLNMPQWKKTFINEKLQIEGEIQILQADQKIMVNKHRNLEYFSPFSGTNIKLNPWDAKKLMH